MIESTGTALEVTSAPLRATLGDVERRLILFAHGAGAPSSSAWMQSWAARLASLGEVVTFDYPYFREGRRRPDPQPVLLEAHRAACAEATRSHAGPLVLAGKSMGGRLSCHLALERPAQAVVCFGYPLRGATGALRDRVLRALEVPVLFIQGSRDRLCPPETLEQVRAEMSAPSSLHVVPSGDHSLQAGKAWLKAEGLDQAAVDDAILSAVRAFLAEHITMSPTHAGS